MHGKGGIFLNTTTGDTHVILEFGLGFLTVLHEAFVFVLLSQIIFLEDDQGRSIQEPQKKKREYRRNCNTTIVPSVCMR